MTPKLRQCVIIFAYCAASIWLTATAAFAFYSISAPLPEPQIVSSSQPEVALSPNPTLSPPLIAEAELRDPFSKLAPQAPIALKPDTLDPSGFRLKAVIISLKNGAVIEDTRNGSVNFVSEGESFSGAVVKTIATSRVTVEVEGNTIELTLSGGQP